MIAKRIAGNRAQVVDLDDDSIDLCQCCVSTIGVRFGGQLIAFAAGTTGTSTGSRSVEVLGGGSVEAWVVVETAGGGVGVAIAGAEGVSGAVSVQGADVLDLVSFGLEGRKEREKDVRGEGCDKFTSASSWRCRTGDWNYSRCGGRLDDDGGGDGRFDDDGDGG